MAEEKKTGGFTPRQWVYLLIATATIILFATSIKSWGKKEYGEVRWSSSAQPRGPVKVVMRKYDLPLTGQNSEDLMRPLADGEYLERQVFGAVVHYSGMAVDNEGRQHTFEYDQGPDGSVWHKDIRNKAYILYCRIADSQPEGLVVVNPHLRITVYRQSD